MAIGLCAFSFLNSLLIPIHHGTVYVVIAGHSRTDHPVGFSAIAGFQTDLFYMRERIKSIRKKFKERKSVLFVQKSSMSYAFFPFLLLWTAKISFAVHWDRRGRFRQTSHQVTRCRGVYGSDISIMRWNSALVRRNSVHLPISLLFAVRNRCSTALQISRP